MPRLLFFKLSSYLLDDAPARRFYLFSTIPQRAEVLLFSCTLTP